jgi:hypothetical protein
MCDHQWVLRGDRWRCRHCDESVPRRDYREHLGDARRRLQGIKCAVCDQPGGFPQESFQDAVMHDGCAADKAREVTDA